MLKTRTQTLKAKTLIPELNPKLKNMKLISRTQNWKLKLLTKN